MDTPPSKPENPDHPGVFNDEQDALVGGLRGVIRLAVRFLAVIMTLVILWGVVDVVWVIYGKLAEPPIMLLTISDILATFGAFMAVLIAIEIFINITVYLRDDVIHVQIVMATGLMAIARKVIILDTETSTPEYLYGIAALVIAMSVGYWLVVVMDRKKVRANH
jgi:uncharacterized membrane protein (DUF373 family)